MEITDKKNPLYEGNIFWLYECFKTESQDFPFDKPYTDKKYYIENEYMIYECLMFNEDREDSLFVMQDGELYEYFSTDKSELLLKLIQYYENRLKNNISYDLVKDSLPIKRENPLSDIVKKRFKYDPETNFKTIIKANIYIEYRDGTSSWQYNYELKKLLFYMKFLPNASKIRIIRIFPLSIKQIKVEEVNWLDRTDQFFESKQAQLQKVLEDKDNIKLTNLVKKLKTLFYDKYLLNLKKMKLYVFELDNRWYILNVKDFIFEKYENKHVKLSSESLFFKYTENYKDKTKLEKDPQKLFAIQNFFNTMWDKYEDLFYYVVPKEKYLELPKKDKRSDEAYRLLKPESPYTLSTLMEPRIGIKTFVKYATYNLWNQDDKVEDK